MATRTATLALLFVALTLAAVSCEGSKRRLTQVPTTQQCNDAFNAAGGAGGLQSKAPSCAPPPNLDVSKCCEQVKGVLNGGQFTNCMCNPDVKGQVIGAVNEAGISGLNEQTFGAFLESCGIPSAGGKPACS